MLIEAAVLAATLAGSDNYILNIQDTSLHLSLEGEGYELEFSISYPADLTIPPVATIPFSVGPRPLGVK